MPTEHSEENTYTHLYPCPTPASVITRDEERIRTLATLIGTPISTAQGPSSLQIRFPSADIAAFVKWMLLGGSDPGRAARPPPRVESRSQMSIDYTKASLHDLVEIRKPSPTPAVLVDRFKVLLQEAQIRPPENGERFAQEANRLLDLCGLKLVSHGATNGRIRCSKRNYLYISYSAKGCRGFQNADLELVAEHTISPEVP